ncbi:MAG: mechanosensitive ion channel family protein [Deltaproteobacteria bacterium]|jgi:small-conductance mechanosensitive channel|nr:mechanosensitive ion channel family protein [Deltaproteobacteria bacterium]
MAEDTAVKPQPQSEPQPELDLVADHLPAVADWLPSAALPVWEAVARFPLLRGLILAAVFLLLAIVLRFMVAGILGRLAGLTKLETDDRILQDLKRPIFTTVAYLGFALAVQAAMLPFGTLFIASLMLSVIVASWMRAALRISSSLLDLLEKHPRFALVEPRTIPIFDLTIKLFTILVGSYVLLLIWGINPVGWLASAGIVGIAVGFAAKDTLANLFSGFFIVADAPYKIGDYINLDTGERGQVSAIGLRSTRLMTRDDVEITIPNGVIANAKIVNESGGPSLKIRSRIEVGVAYGSDVDRVCEILQRIGESHRSVCSHPEPRVRMRGFGGSSLDFELLVWIDHPEDRGIVRHELLMAIYKAFAAEGIEIPYSKHDVFIKELPAER